MNIFVLSKNPAKAAQYMCDRHIIKMILESSQILCTAFPAGVAPYKRSHYNHPCSKWVRKSHKNFMWLVKHAYALNEEYKLRYNKSVDHKSIAVVKWCEKNLDKKENNFKYDFLTKFPKAMPDSYKTESVVTSYRTYYLKDKIRFAVWVRGRKAPRWWINAT